MKPLPILVPAVLMLAACTPTASDAASSPKTGMAETKPATAPSTAAGTQVESAARPSTDARVVEPTGASISGAIRDGNRPPPALRVCATPVAGGASTCIDTREGARDYRIAVTPGRYYLLGWAQSGELALIAHASQIRCIRAPCPPDELIEITVAAGEQREGVDLDGGYVDVPDGWPKRPG